MFLFTEDLDSPKVQFLKLPNVWSLEDSSWSFTRFLFLPAFSASEFSRKLQNRTKMLIL